MSKFETLYPLILANEVSPTNPTGLVDIPGDTGGVTKWGISQRSWSQLYYKYADYPIHVTDLTGEQAKVIYEKEYYPNVCDGLPMGAALIVFDCNVNQGIGIKCLQIALGVTPDGLVGPETTGAIRLALRDVPALIDNLLWARLGEYQRISKASTVNQGFLAKLWVPRLLTLRRAAHQFEASNG
jgi:lysozyme family protein